ncbi:D-alanyl-D-alanine dipeptidase [Aerosticca soli]|uniref:D-alanyl-D-alanine dipeptidase n=2 Tax=Aerosticca soli TaxID=2010829 RepID=A0A2Z6E7E1_9GAMM|nr:D-alanyl-D-alanine dipeptidase [Aerosticca soli]
MTARACPAFPAQPHAGSLHGLGRQGRPYRRAARVAVWTMVLVRTFLGVNVQAAVVPPISPARTATAAGLIDVRSRVPDLALDIQYAGSDNFLGRPAKGYLAPKCLLLPTAADALARAERALRAQGYRLLIWDCYRPVRAVDDFVRWAHAPAEDERGKAAHYPRLAKSQLLGDYIAPVSGHSQGATVDLTLLRCVDGRTCAPLDMGTGFDYFDPLAHTDAPGLTADQRANRARLRAAMEEAGFRNYPLEWWHYTFDGAAANLRYDVPVE